MNNNIIVRCHNLTKYYPVPLSWKSLLLFKLQRRYKPVLTNINFSVKKGEIFAIVGPNGAGKTTLLKILGNLTTPTDGSAYIFGLDVTKAKAKIMERLGYCLSEERSFFWRLTGRQNLEFFATLFEIPYKLAKERIEEYSELFNLTDSLDDRFLNYSSGMKQKMSIIRSLLPEPDILIMDEPTKGLDPSASLKVKTLLKDLSLRKGKTIIFTTNRMNDIVSLSSNILILNHGKTVFYGTLQEMCAKVSSETNVPSNDIEMAFNKLIDDSDSVIT